MTEVGSPHQRETPAATVRPSPKPATGRARKAHPASGGRILAAGLAAGAGLALVGAMSASAQTEPATPVAAPTRRVVVVDRTQSATPAEQAPGVTAAAEVAPAPLPLPPPVEVQPAPPVTESQGS